MVTRISEGTMVRDRWWAGKGQIFFFSNVISTIFISKLATATIVYENKFWKLSSPFVFLMLLRESLRHGLRYVIMKVIAVSGWMCEVNCSRG